MTYQIDLQLCDATHLVTLKDGTKVFPFDKPLDLLLLSSIPELLENGTITKEDILSPDFKLGNLYYSVNGVEMKTQSYICTYHNRVTGKLAPGGRQSSGERYYDTGLGEVEVQHEMNQETGVLFVRTPFKPTGVTLLGVEIIAYRLNRDAWLEKALGADVPDRDFVNVWTSGKSDESAKLLNLIPETHPTAAAAVDAAAVGPKKLQNSYFSGMKFTENNYDELLANVLGKIKGLDHMGLFALSMHLRKVEKVIPMSAAEKPEFEIITPLDLLRHLSDYPSLEENPKALMSLIAEMAKNSTADTIEKSSTYRLGAAIETVIKSNPNIHANMQSLLSHLRAMTFAADEELKMCSEVAKETWNLCDKADDSESSRQMYREHKEARDEVRYFRKLKAKMARQIRLIRSLHKVLVCK